MGYFDVLSSKMALIFKFRDSMTSLCCHNRKYGRFCNFVVYQSRMAKFGRLGYFDVYFSKKLSIFKIEGFYDVIMMS